MNRHHATSLNVMAVAGPDLKFFYANIHAPGRWHDSRVMRTSQLPRLYVKYFIIESHVRPQRGVGSPHNPCTEDWTPHL